VHYGRRVTTAADEDSDRATGEVMWFCHECGHRPQPTSDEAPADHEAGDDLTELFDRH
jgi:hypothetical protein